VATMMGGDRRELATGLILHRSLIDFVDTDKQTNEPAIQEEFDRLFG